MFSLWRKVIPMLLLLAILVGGCSNPPSPTTVPPVPAATSIIKVGAPEATVVPIRVSPTVISVPTNTPAPTRTPAPALGATCLVGTWEVIEVSDYFAGVMSHANSQAAIVSHSGRLLYSFAPDGHAAIKADNFQQVVEDKTLDLAIKMVVTLSGQATSAYTAKDPNKFTFANLDNSQLKINATVNGMDVLKGTTADDFDAAFGVSADPKYSTSTYTCDGDTLKITPPIPGAHAVVLKRSAP